MSSTLSSYRDKHALYPLLLQAPVPQDLGVIVVIPCYNEPALFATLDSLWRCHRPTCAVEVLIVLNAPEGTSAEILARHQETAQQLAQWQEQHQDPTLGFHLLAPPPLPPKHAGVGLARKIGLDEALARFAQMGGEEGLLVSLDADCLVAPNYLRALEAFAQEHPKAVGACLYYEHPITTDADQPQDHAIIQYELYLRYYVQGQRFAGHPFWLHTVGSTIVVRAISYARIGGMNKRKAGEDFYFLQKLSHFGQVISLGTTCVYPSSRPSDRNPFGTGPAVQTMLSQDKPTYMAYDPRSFSLLKDFLEQIPTLYQAATQGAAIEIKGGQVLLDFLEQQSFAKEIQKIIANTASWASFAKRFYQWFNAFMTVRWVHFARERQLPDQPVTQAAATLLSQLQAAPAPTNALQLLEAYRKLDQEQAIGSRAQQEID